MMKHLKYQTYRTIVTAFVLPILCIAPAGAFVENSCQHILVEGFYNAYSRSNAQLRDQAMYAKLCSSNFQQARQAISRAWQSGTDRSFGVSYGLFSPGGNGGGQSRMYPSSGSFSEDRFNQWKSAYCSKNSLADSSRAAEFLIQKIVPPSVTSAWSACMRKREGLTCWATPNMSQNEEVLLNVNWAKNSSTQPQVQHSFLTRGAVSKLEDAARKILPVGYQLHTGMLQIPIARETDKAIVASLQANHDGVEHGCHVFIPGERDFALTTPFIAQ
jgi:hypothetical protein